MKTKRFVAGRILRVLLAILLTVALLLAAGLVFLTVTEYKPADREEMVLCGAEETASVSEGDPLKVLSWNIGYGALGDNADFFMDGGEMVTTATEERLQKNLKGITDLIRKVDPDVALLQEVDSDSSRSHHVDETDVMSAVFSDDTEVESLYHASPFVPYPLPPLKEVHMNLMTLSRFGIETATRIQLPVPFSWPMRTANLKRCLLVSRVPLKDSDKELVFVDLHMEAYDSGEGKEAQTKMLLDVLRSEAKKGNYVIAAGDFNQRFSNVDDSMYPYQEGMWKVGMVDAKVFEPEFSLLMDPSVPTCRSLDKPYRGADKEAFQYYMIDGFIVSGNVKVRSLKTLDEGFRYSDHNPVVLEATLA